MRYTFLEVTMPSITVSLDYQTLGKVRAYMDKYGLETMSASIRQLVKKGIAHELEYESKTA